MKTRLLPTVELQTGPNPSATIIWLHGLGADGHDFEPVVPQLSLPDDLDVRFVFPHAPSIPVSVNGSYIMPAWYDIKHTDIGYEQDAQGVIESARMVQMLIDREEMHGIPSSRIVLAGFSQGGAMAMHVGLRQGEALAGIIALSCYLPLAETVEKEMRSETLKTPIFMAHGMNDPVVPYTLGESAHSTLQSLGYSVTWHSYPMEHSVCHEEIIKIGQWVTSLLSDE